MSKTSSAETRSGIVSIIDLMGRLHKTNSCDNLDFLYHAMRGTYVAGESQAMYLNNTMGTTMFNHPQSAGSYAEWSRREIAIIAHGLGCVVCLNRQVDAVDMAETLEVLHTCYDAGVCNGASVDADYDR